MDIKQPRHLDPAHASQLLESARPQLHVPDDATLRVENVKATARGTNIQFSCNTPVPLEGADLGEASGVSVDVSLKGDLRFDKDGKLVKKKFESPDPQQLDAIRDNVSKLVANEQVYVAQPGEEIDPDKLREAGKPWYVQADENGRLRLKRAYMA